MPNHKLISLQRIWDYAEHNGMTDLIEYQGALFCCFREGMAHKGDIGIIRILKSEDTKTWKDIACLSKPGIDLRDPHFSFMPDGRMMLTLGGSLYKDGEYEGCNPHVAFSSEGCHWSNVQQINLPNEWIWRITWYQGQGYGFSYRLSNPKVRSQKWMLTLFKTKDGLSYQRHNEFDISDYPSEATIRFTNEGLGIALLRRRGHALIGTSSSPYKDWNWVDCGCHVGGPNFIILPDGCLWAGGRDCKEDVDDSKGYNLGAMALGPMTQNKYTPTLYLPCGGDNSYPGLVYKDNLLYISYYSSHEGKACIYLAQVELPI